MEEISICGIAGRFPESSNVEEFWENLMSGKDMVTEDDRRWKIGLWGLPKRNGKLKDLDQFDASFFEVHPKQANNMDPQLRMLLEISFEALLDAGINPSKLAGKRIGVWIGVSGSETREAIGNNPDTAEGYGLTGCCPSMFANRISYFFDFKGPSLVVDTACSSSLFALQMACQSIRDGHCDGAIVGGAHLILKPQTSLQFNRLSMLSPDGACKSFDESGNGYVRSEAIAAIYVGKKDLTQWAYCDVINAKTNCDGRKKEGITFPSGHQQSVLLRETYVECGVRPCDLDYIEAHGTGTKAGDPQELNAIDDVMGAGRESPLLIGSVKSNMGHSEPSSGICAVIKCAMAMRNKMLPPNLHFNKPNPNIDGLVENRLKVVTKPTHLPSPALIGVNSFGFGGSNVHVVLKSRVHDDMESDVAKDNKPLFKLVTARTEEGIKAQLENTSFSTLNNVPDISTSLHPYRGYVINTNDDVTTKPVSDYFQVGKKKEIWYICSGMGTQWKDMGKDLLRIKVFSDAIDRCSKALAEYDFDIREVMLTADDETYNETVNAFVGLASVQIGLIDVLTSLGVEPAGLIGHSVGELACGYADRCLSLEQTIKAAYLRGICVKEANLPLGQMAAVGMTWQDCIDQCPPGVAPACYNSHDSVTISGTKNEVNSFVTSLQQRGVFAKEVNTGGIAFHSKYMKAAYPRFVEELKKVIPNPQNRSERWISTSASYDDVTQSSGNYNAEVLQCSAEYHANNLIKPVMFVDALKKVPENAIAVEIAPHCLLQAILKRSLPDSCSRVALTNRKELSAIQTLLKGFGKLHCLGVGLNTDHISDFLAKPRGYSPHHVAWNHEESWQVPTMQQFMTSSDDGQQTSSKIKLVFSADSPDNYLREHVIDGRSLLPATAHLRFAWQTLAKYLQLPPEDISVQFDDVAIHRATVLPDEGSVEILVQLIPSSNEFRITEGGSLTSSGKIKVIQEEIEEIPPLVENGEKLLTKKEIYRSLRLAGYNYKGDFQALEYANQQGQHGHIKFDGNYVTFLDAILQMSILGSYDHKLRLPTRIRRVRIRPGDGLKSIPVQVDRTLGTITASGIVEVKSVHVTNAPRRGQILAPVLESQIFVPNHQSRVSEFDSQVRQYGLSLTQYIGSNMNTLEERIAGFKARNGFHGGEGDMREIQMNGNLYQLLKHIVEFKSDTGQLTPNEFQTLLEQFSLLDDPLVNYCVAKDNHMTSSLDLMLENSGNFLNIVELSQDVAGIKRDLADVVKPHLDSILGLQYDYVTETYNAVKDFGNANIIIANNLFKRGVYNSKYILESISKSIGNGFILLNENTSNDGFQQVVDAIYTSIDSNYECTYVPSNEIFEIVSSIGFEIVSGKCDEIFGNIVLVIRHHAEKKNVLPDQIFEIKYDDFSWQDKIKKQLQTESHDLWLIGRENANGIMGMTNCLRREPGGKKVRCIVNVSQEQVLPNDLNEVYNRNLAVNVYKNGQWGTFRHVKLEKMKKSHSKRGYVNYLTKGELSSLQWVSSSPKVITGHHEYRVAFSALNFRDVMLATGKLPAEAIPGNANEFSTLLGLEFSGYDITNKRVMGLVPAEGLATHVTTRPKFTWNIPDDWSLSEASTVPVVYCTAYYALLIRGNLRKGESVLIHCGAGGVGQAAIAIALGRKCRVFTTVSTARKREHLMRRFPQLNEESFANSRDTTFENHIMKMTSGKGVDMVLNSLSEEKLEAGLRCVAKHGRFLEIGKKDLAQNSKIGMSVFLRNISFHGILLDALFDEDAPDWIETADHVTQGIKEGVVRPLDATIFQKNELETAFRYMSQGKHISKVLIQVKNESQNITTIERSTCNPNLNYVITGGLGGFGLELCDWLIQRNARRVTITTRSGIKTAYQRRYVNYWKSKGVEVTISNSDVTNEDGARDVLDKNVGGVFHLAMVLQDSLFENQNAKTFKNVCAPKCDGVLNLDRLSRRMCPALQWFVVFSSVFSGRGNAGQTNYGFANSFMERICEQRKFDGFPALAIQWGSIGDVGVAIERLGDNVIGGTVPQLMVSCLKTLDLFLSQSSQTVVSSVIPAPKKTVGKKVNGGKETLSRVVANIIGIQDIGKVDKETSFVSLGLDSLMAVEISQKIERDVGVVLATSDVHNLTFVKLEQLSSSSSEWKFTVTNNVSYTPMLLDDFLLTPKILETSLISLNNRPSDVTVECYFVYPIGGSSSVYRDVINDVNARAWGLNCGRDSPLGSIQELARHYLDLVGQRKRYNLIGYSFGACVALEMAYQLDGVGCDVNLILVDGSHTFVSERTKAISTVLSTEQEQQLLSVALFICDVIPSLNYDETIKELSLAQYFSGKVKVVEKMLQTAFPDYVSDFDDLFEVVSMYYQRLLIGHRYQLTGRYRGDITLIKQKNSTSSDYHLRDVCDGNVDVIDIDASHAEIIQSKNGQRICHVINNLCE